MVFYTERKLTTVQHKHSHQFAMSFLSNTTDNAALNNLRKHYLIDAAPVAEWFISALNCSSSHRCGFEPSSGHMCDKSSSACRWWGVFFFFFFFSGISDNSRFRPTKRLTLLKMSEIILTGRKTQIKKNLCLRKSESVTFRN